MCSFVQGIVFPKTGTRSRGEMGGEGAQTEEGVGTERGSEREKEKDRQGRIRRDQRERVRRVARRAVREGLLLPVDVSGPVSEPESGFGSGPDAETERRASEGREEGSAPRREQVQKRRAVEPVGMGGRRLNVDVSFAKGEWGLRWKN